MIKYFIVADVHSYYKEMMSALDKAGFDINNPTHIFVSLGDLMDRGPETYHCLQFVNSIPGNRKILIRGNHEDLIEECLDRRYFTSYDYSNGTAQSVMDIGNAPFVDNADDVFNLAYTDREWLKYKDSLVNYYEDKKNIFVHGWIPCDSNDPNKYHTNYVKYWYDPGWRTGNWEYARWINGMEAWWQGVKEPGKTIYCGHWHCSWGWSHIKEIGTEFNKSKWAEEKTAHFEPFIEEGIVALDACTAYSEKVNCVVVEYEEGDDI